MSDAHSFTFPDEPRGELDLALDNLVEKARDVLKVQGRLRSLLKANQAVIEHLELPVVLERIVAAAVELAAVRIVQEALTNVLVHAQATLALVEIRLTDDGLLLDIHDNGTAGAPPTQPIEVISARGSRAGRSTPMQASTIVSVRRPPSPTKHGAISAAIAASSTGAARSAASAIAAVSSVEPSSTTITCASNSSRPIRRSTSPIVAASLYAGIRKETFTAADLTAKPMLC